METYETRFLRNFSGRGAGGGCVVEAINKPGSCIRSFAVAQDDRQLFLPEYLAQPLVQFGMFVF